MAQDEVVEAIERLINLQLSTRPVEKDVVTKMTACPNPVRGYVK